MNTDNNKVIKSSAYTIRNVVSLNDTEVVSTHDKYCDHNNCLTYYDNKIKENSLILDIECDMNITEKYDKINEPEIVLFHGTYGPNIINILQNGLDPQYCCDPSFGHGLYMTPCILFSMRFTGNSGAIFCCKVKLGDCKNFLKYDTSYIRESQNSNKYTDEYTTEYVIYDANRIKPFQIILIK
jgi:hypothetical protein